MPDRDRVAAFSESMMPDLKQLAFSEEEYRRRVRRVQELLVERDLDALLVHHFPSICYLTGMQCVLWTKYFLTVIRRDGDPILLGQAFELPNALYCVWTPELVGYELDDDPIEVTVRLLERLGLDRKRLGIETSYLRAPVYLRLIAALSSATLVDASDLVDTVKAIKSAPELDLLRQTAHLTDAGMMAALDAVADGALDQDVARAAYDALIGGGSEYMALDPIVTVGQRSGIPHSTHARIPMRTGDTVLIELGANLHRYTAASFRCAVIGEPFAQVSFMADSCISSLNSLIGAMKPGAVAHDVAAVADRAWTEATSRFVWHGYYAYSLGIGFPIDWNDCPLVIKHGEDWVLQSGMVFHCTTSLRDPAKYGTALSETVVITETGAEVLTNVPRELRIA